jgi:hypothetical protein
MRSKSIALSVVVASFVSSVLVILHARASERRYLCEEVCGYLRYDAFLGLIFLTVLFVASVSIIRILTSDVAFRAWKRFMTFFVPIATLFALPAFMGGGGAWAIGSGPDSEITMWIVGIVYTLVSIGIIVRHAVRERQTRNRGDGVEGDDL